jgi:hypothetical protein
MQMLSNLRFIQIATQSNGLVSALNTDTEIAVVQFFFRQTLFVARRQIGFSYCDSKNIFYSAGFYSRTMDIFDGNPSHLLAILNRLYGACKPLDALLETTLDCLREDRCLTTVMSYFPALNHVGIAQFSFFQNIIGLFSPI